MFGLPSPQELLIILVIIGVLTYAGVWPRLMKGLRELRGERVDEPAPTARDLEFCYKMLGLSPTATWQEVESAYRRKAKRHHPDHGGDEDAMRALNDVYAQLKRKYRQ